MPFSNRLGFKHHRLEGAGRRLRTSEVLRLQADDCYLVPRIFWNTTHCHPSQLEVNHGFVTSQRNHQFGELEYVFACSSHLKEDVVVRSVVFSFASPDKVSQLLEYLTLDPSILGIARAVMKFQTICSR